MEKKFNVNDIVDEVFEDVELGLAECGYIDCRGDLEEGRDWKSFVSCRIAGSFPDLAWEERKEVEDAVIDLLEDWVQKPFIEATEYNYKELVEQATRYKATQDERTELLYWFEKYGSQYWNGESYKINSNLSLYPIYKHKYDEDGNLLQSWLDDCEIR